jgi:DNA invertase Pin-like site-specific DNA recombinase
VQTSIIQSATVGKTKPHADKKLRRDPPSIEALLQRPGDFIAATYIRESRFLSAVDGFGMGAQDKDTRQFCVKMGWPNPDDLNFADGVDEDASGADWDLKDLNRMLDAAEQGRFQVLVVPRNDRFARNMVKALVLEKQLLDRGIRVVFLNLPLNTQGTPEGDILKNTLHSFAEYDRAKIALNTARGRRAKAEMGLFVGTGPIPYGYKRVLGTLPGVRSALRVRTMGLEIDETTAPAVRQIFEWATYLACAEITDRLTHAGEMPRGASPAGCGRACVRSSAIPSTTGCPSTADRRDSPTLSAVFRLAASA